MTAYYRFWLLPTLPDVDEMAHHSSWVLAFQTATKEANDIIWKCGGANSLWSKGWPSANRKTEEIPKSYEMIQGIVCPDSLFGNSHVVKQTYLLITCHCETMASVVMHHLAFASHSSLPHFSNKAWVLNPCLRLCFWRNLNKAADGW